MKRRRPSMFVLSLSLFACSGNDDTDGDIEVDAPDTYEFTSRFDDNSSVSYSGQVFRNLLVDDMNSYINDMTARIDVGWVPVAGDVKAEVMFYLDFDSDVAGDLDILKTAGDNTLVQSVYDDISSGKNILGKMAGNDAKGQHKDWAAEFEGWGPKGSITPEGLVTAWVDMLDAHAVDYASGNAAKGPDGKAVEAIYLTAQGHDLNQLIQKFTRMSLAFSQGADDYLDDDTEGKGLLSTHAAAEDGKNYSALEHGWDEGFGYFGASAFYGTWTDAEIKAGYMDVNGDGKIDLKSELNWGHSINAAKRDLGSAESGAPTDFTADAWAGFALGRQLLSNVSGELSESEMDELKGYRDQAVMAWEKAVASTVVHYINDVLQDMGTFGTDTYSFANHAKHWSEMKGFALGLQFSRFSPMSDADFGTFHSYVETAPVLPNASVGNIADYKQALLDARALLATSYGFDTANMGDENGENGW